MSDNVMQSLDRLKCLGAEYVINEFTGVVAKRCEDRWEVSNVISPHTMLSMLFQPASVENGWSKITKEAYDDKIKELSTNQ